MLHTAILYTWVALCVHVPEWYTVRSVYVYMCCVQMWSMHVFSVYSYMLCECYVLCNTHIGVYVLHNVYGHMPVYMLYTHVHVFDTHMHAMCCIHVWHMQVCVEYMWVVYKHMILVHLHEVCCTHAFNPVRSRQVSESQLTTGASCSLATSPSASQLTGSEAPTISSSSHAAGPVPLHQGR